MYRSKPRNHNFSQFFSASTDHDLMIRILAIAAVVVATAGAHSTAPQPAVNAATK
jgi:hypothetical protein